MNRFMGRADSATTKAIGSGDVDALVRALARLAIGWIRFGGVPGRNIALTDVVANDPASSVQRSPEQRALLAAGCDLYDLLAETPQGREALLQLGAKPVLKQRKGE